MSSLALGLIPTGSAIETARPTERASGEEFSATVSLPADWSLLLLEANAAADHQPEAFELANGDQSDGEAQADPEELAEATLDKAFTSWTSERFG